MRQTNPDRVLEEVQIHAKRPNLKMQLYCDHSGQQERLYTKFALKVRLHD